MKNPMPDFPGLLPAAVDAAAKALREKTQGHKLLNEWSTIPNSAKRKWWELAAIALTAAQKS